MIKSKNISTRLLENIHVGLWLCKDTFWMLEYKTLGCIMIIPTIICALIVLYFLRKTDEIWVNIAVLCWILANSTWMLTDFFVFNKLYSLPFFILGIIFFINYICTYKFDPE